MVLKLDPRFPVVWRNPFSLQVGIDPVRVRLDNMTLAEEHMMAALAVGVNREGLELIAESSDASKPEVDSLLSRLSPVLYGAPEPRRDSVVVAGSGPTADRITGILAESGVRVFIAHSAESAESAKAELAIVIGHFVFAPAWAGLWLRRDIPHLPVLLGDTNVRIGPIVEPGVTGCLYCFERYRADADLAWAAIASQLLDKRSGIESAVVSSEVAAMVSRLALERLEGNRQSPAAAVLDAASGQVSSLDAPMHPLCGCSTLEETDWASGPTTARAVRPLPRTARASAGRA